MSGNRNLSRRRKARVRKTLKRNLSGRPRLSVFRSGRHIYAQVINDLEGRTLAAASSLDNELSSKFKTGGNREVASEVGKLIATRAAVAGVKEVVFDRGSYLYHGRVRVLAERVLNHLAGIENSSDEASGIS